MTKYPLCSLQRILRLERRPVEVIADMKYAEIGIYCFGKGIFHKEPRSGLEIGDKKLFLIKEGDFILQVTFAWEGAVGFTSKKEDGMYGSTRFPTFRVNEDLCDPLFLLYYFKTQDGREQLIKISPGSAGRNRVLSLKKLHEVQIPLPPIDEQRCIVARIEGLVARIEEARELRRLAVEETDALLKSGMKNLFSFPNHNLQPISKLVTIKGGGTPSKSNPYYWEGTIPWISPKDMKIKEITDSMDHISEVATKESAAKLLDPGVVLIVVRGMILARMVPTAILRVPAAINQDMKALMPGKDLLPEYLCGALWAFNNQILELVEKSTHDTRKLETSKLLDFRIPVPSSDQQRIVVCRLKELQSKLDALKRHQAETAAELDALLPAVLERAFRGEL